MQEWFSFVHSRVVLVEILFHYRVWLTGIFLCDMAFSKKDKKLTEFLKHEKNFQTTYNLILNRLYINKANALHF